MVEVLAFYVFASNYRDETNIYAPFTYVMHDPRAVKENSVSGDVHANFRELQCDAFKLLSVSLWGNKLCCTLSSTPIP